MGLNEQERFEVNYFVQQTSVKMCISFLISIRTVTIMSKYNICITLRLLLQIPAFYSRILINSDRTVSLLSILVCLSLFSIPPTSPLVCIRFVALYVESY